MLSRRESRTGRAASPEDAIGARAPQEKVWAPALEIEVLEERNAPTVWRVAREFQQALGQG